MSRDLELVYRGLIDALNGLELSDGGVLTADGHVTSIDSVTRQQLPYLAVSTGSIDMSEWGPEDWTDEIRWTIPAQLVVQSDVADGGSLMRSVLVDLMQHARRIRGLPYDDDGQLSVDDGSTRYVDRLKSGEVTMWADRKGPHISSIQVDGPFDSGKYVARLTLRLAFLMNLDPRELERAQVAVIGIKTFDVSRSDVNVLLPAHKQMPKFTDADRIARGRFSVPPTRVVDNGIPGYASLGTGSGVSDQRISERLREIIVNPRSVSIAVLATQQLSALVYFQDDVSQHITAAATWSSSDDTKATVSSAGLVTGVAAGSATITATYSGLTATCAVTVT